MKVYISGPMSSVKDWNHESFFRMERALEIAGHEPVNPAKLNTVDTEYRNCLAVDIVALLECEAIILLPDWQRSKGVLIELVIARLMGMKFMTLVNLDSGSIWVGQIEWPMKDFIKALVIRLQTKS